jgi:hypothetical protein
MIIPAVLLAAALASAQAPGRDGAVSAMKENFIEATDESARVKILDEIAATRPVSAQDVSALFDLFSRFADPNLRKKVMASLALIDPSSPQLEPLFLSYLQQPEPEAQLFGINGAFRVRSRQALPLVRKIAERKFAASDASAIALLSQRNAWWTQYEALSVLAQWEGEKTIPLLRKKADESPAVARLLGQFFWRQNFSEMRKWARADSLSVRDKALEAAGAQIQPAEARATRDDMLGIVRDPKSDAEVRHRLALKIGASSTDDEVSALIAEHDKTSDAQLRSLLAAAVSYSRSPKAVPLLVRYARESPDETLRKGARTELVDMLGEEQVKKLLEEQKDVKK